jgi:hypothetical protein
VPAVTRRVTQRRATRRRIPTAWAVSALAHALLAGALFWRGRAPQVAEPEIELVIEIDVPVRRDQPPRAAPIVHPHDAPVPPPPRRRAPGQHPDAPSAPAPAPGPVSPSEEPSAEVAIPESASGRPPDLSLRGLPARVQDELAGPAAAPDLALQQRPHRPSVDELRRERERTEDAVATVRGGRVDPLLYEYLRGAKARLESEARRLADGIPVGPGAAARGWSRGYLQRVQEVSRKDASRVAEPDLRDDAARHRPDVLAGYDEAARMAEAGAERRQVEICVDVGSGRASKAMLRRGSGNAALDRLAVDSFEKAAAARPVPPDSRAGRACYEVTISAHRVPPLPVVGCGFDVSGVTCSWPYKKLTAVSSRLVSVEYPPAPGAAQTRSLLRPPR